MESRGILNEEAWSIRFGKRSRGCTPYRPGIPVIFLFCGNCGDLGRGKTCFPADLAARVQSRMTRTIVLARVEAVGDIDTPPLAECLLSCPGTEKCPNFVQAPEVVTPNVVQSMAARHWARLSVACVRPYPRTVKTMIRRYADERPEMFYRARSEESDCALQKNRTVHG